MKVRGAAELCGALPGREVSNLSGVWGPACGGRIGGR